MLFLLSGFALVALLLTPIGLHGIVAAYVRQRERELGVRVALGAPPRSVLGLILRQGARLVVLGLAIGLALAFALTRMISSLLFGVTPTDPAIFIAVVILVAGVALLASYLPARRATKVDPHERTALRVGGVGAERPASLEGSPGAWQRQRLRRGNETASLMYGYGIRCRFSDVLRVPQDGVPETEIWLGNDTWRRHRDAAALRSGCLDLPTREGEECTRSCSG